MSIIFLPLEDLQGGKTISLKYNHQDIDGCKSLSLEEKLYEESWIKINIKEEQYSSDKIKLIYSNNETGEEM